MDARAVYGLCCGDGVLMRELPDGYTVRYYHEHGIGRLVPAWAFGIEPIREGHSTLARVLDGDGKTAAEGIAMCRPGDQFSKRLGRTIALGRALKYLDGVALTSQATDQGE